MQTVFPCSFVCNILYRILTLEIERFQVSGDWKSSRYRRSETDLL